MVKWVNPNNYPFWFYRRVALPAGQPSFETSFSLPRFGDWLFLRSYVQYQSSGVAPHTWDDIEIQLVDNFTNWKGSGVGVPVSIFTSPGVFHAPAGDPKNQQSFLSKSVNRQFVAKTSFSLRFTNFTNYAPLDIDVALQGQIILCKGTLDG